LFGIKCGLLPWSEAELLDAVLKSYRGAREFLPDPGILLRAGLENLRTARRQLPNVSSIRKERGYIDLVGYKSSAGKEIRYRFRYEHYCRLFVSDEQRRLVTDWLMNKNRITLAKPKSGNQRRAQDQFTWPDETRIRSIELVFKKKATKREQAKRKSKAGS
jgi:hypothetical protein